MNNTIKIKRKINNKFICTAILISTLIIFGACNDSNMPALETPASEKSYTEITDVFVFRINSGDDAKFIVPAQYKGNAKYQWKIVWGDGKEGEYSGTSNIPSGVYH